MMKTFYPRLTLIGLLAALGGFAGAALALWVSTRTIYSGVTLVGKTARVDTVVVSDAARPRESKPDQFIVALAGTGQAAVTDSQFSAVVKAIRGGKLHQIGEDSLFLRPDPATPGQALGEAQLLRWVSDSLQITTRNPMSQSVTGATLAITAERLP